MRLLVCAVAVLAVASAARAAAPANQITVGNVRITALSPTLVRVEPKGPMGFEDRTTFVVQDRDSFAGLPIKQLNSSAAGTWVGTSAYEIFVSQSAPLDACSQYMESTDVNSPVRTQKYPNGATAANRDACCALCTGDADCTAWVFAGTAGDTNANCWPLASFDGTRQADDREVGCGKPGCASIITQLLVAAPDGTVLYNQSVDSRGPEQDNLLHWPAPLTAAAYSLTDYPRFFTPAWGPTPIPSGAKVDPALVPTNGYDFRNNVRGDQYVFLLGNSMDSWHASRKEFVTLAGPTPLIPDFAYGTWFTWWHAYTQEEATGDVLRWDADNLPIDVWALDMNWRNTSNEQDRFYNHPDTALFPNFTEWFSFLEQHKLRTYFNDHPFPVDMQTSKKEVDFRWNGLTEWMDRGLTYWWFDRNWGFSIPPPNLQPVGGWNVSHTGGDWDGLDNAAWGSHLYHTTVEVWDKTRRPADFPGPVTLTKFAPPDWRPGMPASDHQENPAQHRYPVWWTGDGVSLQASTQSMVQSGLYDFKPFVHSDCGGDYRPKQGGDLLRWTAHCTFGTVLRFHGNNHRPWSYDNHTEDVIRSYLNTRYKLIPSLIAAGAQSTHTAFPIVTRGDFWWGSAEYPMAADDNQYYHLNDTLVAPVFDSTNNETTRDVWIPPGQWEDAWNGTTVTGPMNASVTQPYERQPMWHRRGGMLVTTEDPGLRVDEQNWSRLTLECWPDISTESRLERAVYSQGPVGQRRPFKARTGITVTTTKTTTSAASAPDAGVFKVHIGAAEDGASRAWVVRMHLLPGQRVASAVVDGVDVTARVVRLAPLAPEHSHAHFPFRGVGSAPAPHAGDVAELHLASAPTQRMATVTLFNSP